MYFIPLVFIVYKTLGSGWINGKFVKCYVLLILHFKKFIYQ